MAKRRNTEGTLGLIPLAHSPIPNIKVWSLGKQYVDAAQVLLDANHLLQAAVLSALALEILLKSFLAENNELGKSITKQGHDLPCLFAHLNSNDKADLLAAFQSIDPKTVLPQALTKFTGIFTKARYFYEPSSPRGVSSEVIYLAQDLCAAILEVARQRNL